MPVSQKAAASERRKRPNLMSRRERTRKEKKCQLCETKTPLKEQFTVTNDLENGTVVKKKNAERRGAESASHYCGECASKRVSQKEAWLNTREGSPAKSKPKGKGKKVAKKGKGKKAKKAAKPKSAKKPKGVKKAKKPKKDEEPF